MKPEKQTVLELPERTLFTRKEVASILRIGVSTLDSLITEDELPRIRIHKRVLYKRNDIEKYISSQVYRKQSVTTKIGA